MMPHKLLYFLPQTYYNNIKGEEMTISFRSDLLKIENENQLQNYFHKKAVKIFDEIFYCAGAYGESYRQLYQNLKSTWKKLYKNQ